MKLSAAQVDSYLLSLQRELLVSENFKSITLSRSWANEAPYDAGVYVLKENDTIVYVGETGNLRGRMRDLLDSRNHIVRRTIGVIFYSDHIAFKKATSSEKFPAAIEALINDHICSKLKISYIAVDLGRKELEELIQSVIPDAVRLNKRGKRIKR